MKDGKGLASWSDNSGPGSSSGKEWVNVEDAEICDPEFCKRPEDACGRQHEREMVQGSTMVYVKRTSIVHILSKPTKKATEYS